MIVPVKGGSMWMYARFAVLQSDAPDPKTRWLTNQTCLGPVRVSAVSVNG
jgi:hypothetical protein